jgi:hypothetical protein
VKIRILQAYAAPAWPSNRVCLEKDIGNDEFVQGYFHPEYGDMKTARLFAMMLCGGLLAGAVAAPAQARGTVVVGVGIGPGFGYGPGFGPGYYPPPVYYAPPPVYYAPPPVYYVPPPPPPPAPPPGYYAPYPGYIAQIPAAPPPPAQASSGYAQSCNAGSYVCPMQASVPVGGNCYCPGNNGNRVYGTAQ